MTMDEMMKMKTLSLDLLPRQEACCVSEAVAVAAVMVIINRINNPLERFNRRLNEACAVHSTRRPKMPVFVEMLKQICHEYVDQIERIIGGQESRPIHEPVFIPTIPVDYASFVCVNTDF